MTIHANSIAAYHSTDFSPREQQIAHYLSGIIQPATDREIAEALGYADLNAIRPRCSEMIERGVLGEALSVKCSVTGKTVRTVYLLVRGGVVA